MKLGSLIQHFGIHEREQEQVDLALPRKLFEEVEREIARAYPSVELELLRARGADRALRLMIWRERFRLLFMHLDDELQREREMCAKGKLVGGLAGEDWRRTDALRQDLPP